MAVAHVKWLGEADLDTVPASHVQGLIPPVFDSKKTYNVFYHPDFMSIEEYKKKNPKIDYHKSNTKHHKPGFYHAMVVMVKGTN